MCALNFGSGNSQNFLPYKLMVIATSFYPFQFKERFQRNTLLWDSGENLYLSSSGGDPDKKIKAKTRLRDFKEHLELVNVHTPGSISLLHGIYFGLLL